MTEPWTWRCPNEHLAFERTEQDMRVRGCAELDCEYHLKAFETESVESEANIKAIFERLPIQLNVGTQEDQTIIGWANGWKDLDSGTTTILMSIDAEAGEKLGDLTELYRLYSMYFAGIRKEPD